MNRRVSSYPVELENGNILLGILSLILGLSFIPFVYNTLMSWIKGPPATDNPWDATTLEWQTASPPPEKNFNEIPVVTKSPYEYGAQE